MLIPEKDLKHFEELGEQYQKTESEIMVVTKLFLPATRRTWYLVEYDPTTKIGYGYVKSGIDSAFDERGTVYLPELEELEIKVPLVMGGSALAYEIPYRVERDEHFNGPRTFLSIKDELND